MLSIESQELRDGYVTRYEYESERFESALKSLSSDSVKGIHYERAKR